MSVEEVNWLKSGKYRIPILRLLSKKAMLPSEIAVELSINRASVSRILGDLRGEGMVKSTKGRTRTITYQATEKGLGLVEELG